ncbi:hypothetical protein LCGC14_0697310 [marine sediment metagenome]|uniref:Uncharacterized protein n=1 Tax=marine sediment metagenome TaxID=412755 RepID=A0A0F9T4S8_9ZZZZ
MGDKPIVDDAEDYAYSKGEMVLRHYMTELEKKVKEFYERFDNRCIDIECIIGLDHKSEVNNIKPFRQRIEKLEKKTDLILTENVVTTTYINRAEGIVKAYQEAYEGHRKKHTYLKKELSELKECISNNHRQHGLHLEKQAKEIKELKEHNHKGIENSIDDILVLIDKRQTNIEEVLRDLGEKLVGWQKEKQTDYDKEYFAKSLQHTIDKLGGGKTVSKDNEPSLDVEVLNGKTDSKPPSNNGAHDNYRVGLYPSEQDINYEKLREYSGMSAKTKDLLEKEKEPTEAKMCVAWNYADNKCVSDGRVPSHYYQVEKEELEWWARDTRGPIHDSMKKYLEEDKP